MKLLKYVCGMSKSAKDIRKSVLNTIGFCDICRNYINWLSTQLSHTGEVSSCEVYAKLRELGS